MKQYFFYSHNKIILHLLSLYDFRNDITGPVADLPLKNEDRIQNGPIFANLLHHLCET